MRMSDRIRVVSDKIPTRPGTQLYVGLCALRDCDGKTYREFRACAGGPKGTPNRKFSPSSVRKRALETGFAEFVPSSPSENCSSELLRWQDCTIEIVPDVSAPGKIGSDRRRKNDLAKKFDGQTASRWVEEWARVGRPEYPIVRNNVEMCLDAGFMKLVTPRGQIINDLSYLSARYVDDRSFKSPVPNNDMIADAGSSDQKQVRRRGVARNFTSINVTDDQHKTLKRIADFRKMKITDLGVEMAAEYIDKFWTKNGPVMEELEELERKRAALISRISD